MKWREPPIDATVQHFRIASVRNLVFGITPTNAGNHYGGIPTTMAYHAFASVIRLIREDAWEFATQKCRDDARKLGLTRAQVGGLLSRLNGADCIGEFGFPCHTEMGTFSADHYLMWVDPTTATRCATNRGVKVYVKLAIRHDSECGDDCLLISFHPSEPYEY